LLDLGVLAFERGRIKKEIGLSQAKLTTLKTELEALTAAYNNKAGHSNLITRKERYHELRLPFGVTVLDGVHFNILTCRTLNIEENTCTHGDEADELISTYEAESKQQK
jgi:hypothetical protein